MIDFCLIDPDIPLGWPAFGFFISGHWFSNARRAAAWDPKGRK